jgi:hypothetical protein
MNDCDTDCHHFKPLLDRSSAGSPREADESGRCHRNSARRASNCGPQRYARRDTAGLCRTICRLFMSQDGARHYYPARVLHCARALASESGERPGLVRQFEGGLITLSWTWTPFEPCSRDRPRLAADGSPRVTQSRVGGKHGCCVEMSLLADSYWRRFSQSCRENVVARCTHPTRKVLHPGRLLAWRSVHNAAQTQTEGVLAVAPGVGGRATG